MNCFLDEEALRYVDLEHKRGGTDFGFLGELSNFITQMDNSNAANFVFGITRDPPTRSKPYFVPIYFDGSKTEYARFIWKRETNSHSYFISLFYVDNFVLCASSWG